MRTLHSKALRAGLLIAAICLAPSLLWGQQRYSPHAHYKDLEKFNYGLYIGLNQSQVRASYGLPAQRVVFTGTPDTLLAIREEPQLGFELGLLGNLKLHKYFDLRFVPKVSLQQRDFAYQFTSGTENRRIESAFLDLPLFLKYKGAVYREFRMFVMTGPQFSFNLTSDERVVNNPELLRISRQNLAWNLSVGFDVYGDLVKISPVLTYSFGLTDVYVPGEADVPGAIQRLQLNTLSFGLTFE